MNVQKGILEQQQLKNMANIENVENNDQLLLRGDDIESINEESLPDDEVEERVDIGDVAAAKNGNAKSEDLLKFQEIVDTDDGTFEEESFEDVVVIEDVDGEEESRLGSDDVESANQKFRANKEIQNFIDDFYTSGFASAMETRFDATIAGSGNLETRLARENLASSVVAENSVDVRDTLAILAIGDVTPERRTNDATTAYGPTVSITIYAAKTRSLTTLGVFFDINTIITTSTVGDTTDGLFRRASGIIALPLGRALRATPVWEVATHPITLAVGWLAHTIGGVLRRRRRVALIACEVAREVDTTEGTGMLRVVAFLLIFLTPDLWRMKGVRNRAGVGL